MAVKQNIDVDTAGVLSQPRSRQPVRRESRRSPDTSRAADLAGHTVLPGPPSLAEDELQPFNNEDLNCTVNATGKLCSAEYYQLYIPSTPLRPIQDTCLPPSSIFHPIYGLAADVVGFAS